MSARPPLLALDQALGLIEDRFGPVTAVVPARAAEAAGFVLGADLHARSLLPAADNSAVDGYALGPGHGPWRLNGRAAAGQPHAGPVAAGEAVRILTGALVPAGTTAIAMQEYAAVEDGYLSLAELPPPGANIRRAGEAVKPGDRVFARGTRLRPLHLGLLADLGLDEVAVHAPLRVALLSSGDELRPAGSATAAHQVIDSNRPQLRAALTRLGCAVTDGPILPDRRDVITEALLAAARDHDLVITTAGMSVGDEDHVPVVLRTRGEMIFHRLALKPGRPVGLGTLGGTPVLGLPGNPGAVAVTFSLLGLLLVRRLAGEAVRPPQGFPLPAAFAYDKPAGDRAVLPGRIGPDGVERVARQAAGNLAWTATATGFIAIEETRTSVAPGEPVTFLPFDGAWP
ncbi:molybdopterin molybdotransferase MoeA [Zavarzinia compransoris]|uniref:Molybdopterin molybdenumtransferase n=1 Tax=Zavarzinia compransoris TaxID=1264899 RepID=A0A317E7Z7_9PROT|nr:molybdopterin molybdotransferase MoeA [Zavarzinia compransoris]PWR23197.1 molybdopterin molybdenumtransferase MoeA [Zavarzinia compransoris]TDP46244.1 molybdopterin molybdochelatase [Zavarzinia compransoris]